MMLSMKHLLATLLLVASSAHAQLYGTLTPEGVPMEVDTVENSKGTVILMHGCGGPQYDREDGWAKKLNEAGFSTVRVHSWKWRGVTSTCSNDSVPGWQRVTEIGHASKWIRSQSWHIGKVSVLGWSNGGTAALAASNRDDIGIDKAVAMYPWCGERRFNDAVVPTQIHIGTDDDWTPARLCRDFFKNFFTKDNTLGTVTEYEGATHTFDRFIEMSWTMNGYGEGGVIRPRTMRTNPEQRDRAIKNVITFLSE